MSQTPKHDISKTSASGSVNASATAMGRPVRVFVTVAEHSADQHAAHVVRALRMLDARIEVHALGGDALRAAGAIVHHDTVSKAAMGLRAFGRAFEVKRLLRWTDAFCRQTPMDLHICCDSWTMNVHFARGARARGVPVLYFIAPQAWASREGRVRELARVANRVACILPFEEKFFRDRGVEATFVGHPLFDEIASRRTFDAPLREVGTAPLIALPCGSRASVARANFPRQLAVAARIRSAFPEARFVVPTNAATHPVVMPMIVDAPYIIARQNSFDELIPGCDLAITVSGTATLHIAAHGVPMIVVYAASRLLWHGVGRWLVRVRTYAQVNLLINQGVDDPTRHAVPEFIPWFGTIEPVADRAIAMLKHDHERATQRRAFEKLLSQIGESGAALRVAHMALAMIRPNPVASSDPARWEADR
jgi:lipid-A-disaccharide synthase